ncbi:hypothetical protein EBZ80_20970 [bacterium]|nr:hypothetical protein [bacterium]
MAKLPGDSNPTLAHGECESILAKFPGRLPVFVLRGRGIDPTIPNLPKTKFLVPRDLTFGQFNYVVRRQLNLAPDKALFLFCNNTLLLGSQLMSEVYAAHKGPDGALRVIYMSESTFGSGSGSSSRRLNSHPAADTRWDAALL